MCLRSVDCSGSLASLGVLQAENFKRIDLDAIAVVNEIHEVVASFLNESEIFADVW